MREREREIHFIFCQTIDRMKWMKRMKNDDCYNNVIYTLLLRQNNKDNQWRCHNYWRQAVGCLIVFCWERGNAGGTFCYQRERIIPGYMMSTGVVGRASPPRFVQPEAESPSIAMNTHYTLPDTEHRCRRDSASSPSSCASSLVTIGPMQVVLRLLVQALVHESYSFMSIFF